MKINFSGDFAVLMSQTPRDDVYGYPLLHEETGVCMTQCMGSDCAPDVFYGVLFQIRVIRIIGDVPAVILKKQIATVYHTLTQGVIPQPLSRTARPSAVTESSTGASPPARRALATRLRTS